MFEVADYQIEPRTLDMNPETSNQLQQSDLRREDPSPFGLMGLAVHDDSGLVRLGNVGHANKAFHRLFILS
jgi:hypothetical protein